MFGRQIIVKNIDVSSDKLIQMGNLITSLIGFYCDFSTSAEVKR